MVISKRGNCVWASNIPVVLIFITTVCSRKFPVRICMLNCGPSWKEKHVGCTYYYQKHVTTYPLQDIAYHCLVLILYRAITDALAVVSHRIGPTDAVQTLNWAGALVQWLKLAACLESRRSRVRTPLSPSNLRETKYFFPAHSWWFNIVRNIRDREVAC